MALNWNTKNVEEQSFVWRQISKEEYKSENRSIIPQTKMIKNGVHYEMTKRCHCLIWSLGLHLGISEITHHNYDKVFNRMYLWERVKSPNMRQENPKTGKSEPYYYTKDSIKAMIGLSTNGVILSKKEFLDGMFNDYII